ncbi:hypothetical protein Nepgr_016135 [Nepenthes gracilis]|uniref:DOG1 domain-containing protein n=1 Tax=Nepenthes gracilis TaxID=150966 RepID=A0AAD3XRS3_NEPGR|nr:hypothetical protein Nepgr_016135 [Nepenthes gracilis]
MGKLLLLLLFSVVYFPLVMPFTVVMSDSTTPKTLVDAPQTGFAMNNNGARTDSREQEAVYDVMRATGNAWATDIPDVCRGRWHGIECMPDNDNVYHVVSLSFGALSDDTAFPTCDPVRSSISPSISKLPHLRTLFFYRCFSYNPQPIPSFLGQLGPSLQTLVLRENGHVGPIPIELGNLTHLRVLDLHRNNLNGSIPGSLGRMTALRSLDLSGNKLTGRIPDSSFPLLNVLDLSQNLLMGSIPSSIGTCQALLKMDFSRNRLSGPMPSSIEGLRALILMDLSFNRLTGPIPTSLNTLSSLQALILKGNKMSSTALSDDAFDGMENLVILVLSNMDLQGPIPTSIGRLQKIRVIHLDGNGFNRLIPMNFRDLKNLGELRLNDNRLTGPIPLGKDMVWKMGRKLRLYNNSGLCFNPSDDFEGEAELSMDSGIGYCSTPKPGLAGGVQHLGINGDEWSIRPIGEEYLLTTKMIRAPFLQCRYENEYREIEDEELLPMKGVGEDEIHDLADRFTCMTLHSHKRDYSAKRGEEISPEKYGLWREEQRTRAARLEKQVRARSALEELIEEQLNRFSLHYNQAMVPTRLKDMAHLLMPKWMPPLEMASLGWLGDWRPTSILELLRCLARCSLSFRSLSSESVETDRLLSQLIREVRVEEAVLDEEMAEIQATCILHLPFGPPNRRIGPALPQVQSEFKKIERVILKAQQLRFKTLELVVKKVLRRQEDAAAFLVAFAAIQDSIHEFAAQHRFQKGSVSVPIAKALGPAW